MGLLLSRVGVGSHEHLPFVSVGLVSSKDDLSKDRQCVAYLWRWPEHLLLKVFHVLPLALFLGEDAFEGNLDQTSTVMLGQCHGL